jgi:tetratricopeptide (TPR) repeat protein
MARCNWMQNDLPGAEREFVAAIAKDEAAVDYLKQCLKAVRQEMTQSAEWRQKVDETINLPAKSRMAAISELLQQIPYDAELHAQRAVLLGEGGHFAEAGADFDQALDLQENTTWRFDRACIRLYLGDQKGYLEDCQVMYKRSIYIDSHGLSNQACKTCLLQAGAVPDAGRIVEIINRHIKAQTPGNSLEWDLLNMGIAEYRLGNFDPAIVWLDKAKQSTIAYPATITAALFEAMASFKAGRKQVGKDQLAACVQRIETDPLKAAEGDMGGFDNWLICQIALREAKALIR